MPKKRIIAASLVVSLYAGAAPLVAEKLAPIGQRVYVQTEDDPYSELKIEPLRAAEKTPGSLRDPGHRVSKSPVIKIERVVEKKKPEVVDYKPRAIKFRAAKISGRISKPRVSFTRELLPVKRADEPLVQDFYNRVFSETSGDL